MELNQTTSHRSLIHSQPQQRGQIFFRDKIMSLFSYRKQESGDMYSTGNIFDNIITLYSDTWLLDFHDDHVIKYINAKSLCCAPETHISYIYLYFNKKKEKIGSAELSDPSQDVAEVKIQIQF